MRCSTRSWLLVTAGLVSLSPMVGLAVTTQVLAGRARDLSVTVYRAPSRAGGALDLNQLGGFALVRETREVSIPAGETRLVFEGVADGIEPASALITGLPGGILEKNRDSQVLSPSALVAATLGRSLVLVRTNPKSGEETRLSGTIRSDAEGGVVFQSSQGVEALRCSGLPETFSFSGRTDLAATPTLSTLIRSPKPVTATVTLSYLARGFDWTASYVATLSPDGKTMDIGAWVTLANGNGVTFPTAQTQVVAGRLNRESGDIEPLDPGHPILAQCWPRGSTSDPAEAPDIARARPLLADSYSLMEDVVVTGMKREALSAPAPSMALVAQLVQEEQLGDLKLYRVPEHTTVASRQSKQVRLLDRHAVPVQVYYGMKLEANRSVGFAPAERMVRSKNDTAHHLGLPLPSGNMSSFVPHEGATLLLGESSLRDVAVDEEFEVSLGDSPDVQVRSVLERRETPAKRVEEIPLLPGVLRLRSARIDEANRVEIRNARASAITFELRLGLRENTQLIGSDPAPAKQAGPPVFKVRVPAGGSTTIRYQTEHGSQQLVPG